MRTICSGLDRQRHQLGALALIPRRFQVDMDAKFGEVKEIGATVAAKGKFVRERAFHRRDRLCRDA